MLRNASFGFFSLFAVALLSITLPGSVFAGTISSATDFGPTYGFGPGLGTVDIPVIDTPNPNNDNVSPPAENDNNIVVPVKKFSFNGYIDMEFNTEFSDGTSEYVVLESIDNDTGVPWIGFRMELGYGVGDEFVLAGDADDLDFDWDDLDSPPTSSVMTTVDHSAHVLLWGGGFHDNGIQDYEFRIDVPDLGLGGEPLSFTIRQTPIPENPIPEPATAALALVGGLLMLAWKTGRTAT